MVALSRYQVIGKVGEPRGKVSHTQTRSAFHTDTAWWREEVEKKMFKKVLSPTCRKFMSPLVQPYPAGLPIGMSISSSGDRGGEGGSSAITIDGSAAASRFMRGERGTPPGSVAAGAAAAGTAARGASGSRGCCCILDVDVVGEAAVSDSTMLQGRAMGGMVRGGTTGGEGSITGSQKW